jgi:UDP-N-acetylglucosamine transferase subunit ALG13
MPLVAVLLGTDHHPFDRLVTWVDALRRTSDADWFVQRGYTKVPPGIDGSRMLSSEELAGLLRRADAVVTHGGPGLIMEARAAGHFPIVVPRDPKLHEHVDGHQQRFAEFIADAGLAVTVHNLLELRLALMPALARGREPRGLPGNGQDASKAFGDHVARLLAGSMDHTGREGRP